MTGKTDWIFKPAELDTFLSDKGHNALLGIRYHAHEPGWLELELPFAARLTNNGALASGAIMTLMDNAAGSAIYLMRGGYLPQVTLDLRTDYVRPVLPGASMICRTECFGISGTTALTRGIAYQDTPDDPVCHVTATFMLL